MLLAQLVDEVHDSSRVAAGVDRKADRALEDLAVGLDDGGLDGRLIAVLGFRGRAVIVMSALGLTVSFSHRGPGPSGRDRRHGLVRPRGNCGCGPSRSGVTLAASQCSLA